MMPRGRSRWWRITPLLAAVACGGGGQARKGPPTVPVRVATASLIDAPVNIVASGVVEPMQSVAVTAQISGSLLDVAFKEGDAVTKGQLLFHIDPRPLRAVLDQVRATLARDEAQADAARKDDDRYRRLADMGYVSRSQADQMHATAAASAATVAADQAALRAAQVNLGFATIRAPISGRTGSLLVRAGNNVSPGSAPLVVINQISPALVRFPVLAQDFDVLQRALAGHSIPVRATSSDSLPKNELGHLDFLDNAIDSLTGTVTGKARFENTDRRLWPGELVFLTLEVSVQRGVVAIPTPAVQSGQQGTFVYVVDARRSTATTRNVATGIQVGDLTVVTNGLAVGERVVTDGQSRLNPGSKVAIVPAGDTAGATLRGTSAGSPSSAAGVAGGEVATGGASNGAPGSSAAGGGRGSPASAVSNGAAAGGTGQPNLPPPLVRSPSSTGTATTPATPTATPAMPATTTPNAVSTPNPTATPSTRTGTPVVTPPTRRPPTTSSTTSGNGRP
jgi:multidrug efflux system membrane fusion protein